MTATESLTSATEQRDEGPIRRFGALLAKLLVGNGPSDTSGYYVTSSQWPPGVPRELELPPEVVSDELDKAFDGYFDAAMAALGTVDPEAELPKNQAASSSTPKDRTV